MNNLVRSFIGLFLIFGLFVSAFSITPNEIFYQNEDACMPYFKYSIWSECSNGEQDRLRIDLNGCFSDKSQIRTCETNFSEIDLLFLNAKNLSLKITDINSKFYLSEFYEDIQIVKTNNTLPEAFIIYNSGEKIGYLAQKVDSDDFNSFYSMMAIDYELFDSNLLIDLGLVQKTVGQETFEFVQDIAKSRVLPQVLIVIAVMLVITSIFAISFYIKRLHRKDLYKKLAAGHEHSEKADSEHFGDVQVQRYAKHIAELKKFIADHPGVSHDVLRAKLEKLHWNKEILDSVFGEKKEVSSIEEKKSDSN